MKDKVLVFIAGLLVGAILTTGVFMIINKNNPKVSPNNRQGQNGPMFNGPGGPPTQEQLDSMEKIVLEDGTVQYRSPDGGMMFQRRDAEGPGGGPGMRTLP